VIVAVTGHRDLRGAEEWVRQEIDHAVSEIGATRGLTSLADGADQIFADVLLARRVPFHAVIPCAQYATCFDATLVRYRRLLAAAENVITLPFDLPSNEAYMAAGVRVVDDAAVLIAVWDGLPARGPGGTGDVVAHARAIGRRVIHLDPFQRRRRD
jgi:hypothetical protein